MFENHFGQHITYVAESKEYDGKFVVWLESISEEKNHLGGDPLRNKVILGFFDSREEARSYAKRVGATLSIEKYVMPKIEDGGNLHQQLTEIWTEPPFRTCEFCGCYTNAHVRACCSDGRKVDCNCTNCQK